MCWCVCVWEHLHHGTPVQLRGHFKSADVRLLLHWFPGFELRYQAPWQVPSHSEVSCPPMSEFV